MSVENKRNSVVEELMKDLNADGIRLDKQQYNKLKNGDKYTMSDIGVLYLNKQKYTKAMRWYKLAVDDDMPTTLANIAQLYELGLGVPVDYLRALKWYLKSAIHEDKYVFYSIAGLFERGLGVPFDKEKAVEWYFKYNPDGDFIKRYEEEGNIITDNMKDKPLGRMIKEAEAVLDKEVERRKKQKENEEKVDQHRIIHIDNTSQTKLEQDIRQANKKIYRLEGDSKYTLDEVKHLKRNITDFKRKEAEFLALQRKYHDDIKVLREMVLELHSENKEITTRLQNVEKDNKALRTATFSHIKKRKVNSNEQESSQVDVSSQAMSVDTTTCDSN